MNKASPVFCLPGSAAAQPFLQADWPTASRLSQTLGVMYKLALALSTTPSSNVFRAALGGALNSGYLNHFLLCSGFFHERVNSKGPFYASDAFKGVALLPGSTVTVVGAYEPAAQEFDDFVTNVTTHLNKGGVLVPVNQRRSLKKYANRWHAKVFIAREGNEPRFAVVGSSNLTRNAFDAKASNNEADVLIWDDAHLATRTIAASALGQLQGAADRQSQTVIVANYDANDSRNSIAGPMNSRLQQLWADVIAATA